VLTESLYQMDPDKAQGLLIILLFSIF